MIFVRSFNLEQFCLSTIFQNLKIIINSRNIPEKLIDCLLRLYGEELFERYYSHYSACEDSMIWFLRPYTKEIKLVYYSEKITKQLQVVGLRITSLSVSGSLVSDSVLNSIICCVPNVENIDFSFSNCSDKTLLLLQRMCPHIVSIDLKECKNVSDHGLRNLHGTNLKHLNLTQTNITEDGIFQVLKTLPSLQTIESCNFTDTLYQLSLVNPIFSHYNLVELVYNTIGYGSAENVLLAWSVFCPFIKKAHIKFPVTGKVILILSQFQYLEDLKLDFKSSKLCRSEEELYDLYSSEMFDTRDEILDDILLPFTSKINMLTKLDLACINLSMATLVKCYKKVKWLRLDEVSFSSFEEKEMEFHINNLSTLTVSSVNLSCSQTYKAFLWLLSVSQNVEYLYLIFLKELPKEMLSVVLNSYKKLSVIDLSFTPVTIESLHDFFYIPTLEKIFANCCYKIPSELNSNLRNLVIENYGNSLSWRRWESEEDISDNWE